MNIFWLISNVLDTLYRISSPRLGDYKCTTLWIKLKHIVETINFMRYSFYHVLPSFSLNLYLFCKNANWQLLHTFTASTSSTLRMAKRFLKINITHFIFEHMFINLWKKIKKTVLNFILQVNYFFNCFYSTPINRLSEVIFNYYVMLGKIKNLSR